MILLEATNKPSKKYKCNYCEKRLAREDLIHHVDKHHTDMIP